MGTIALLSIIPWETIFKYSPMIVEAGGKIFNNVNKYFGSASKEGGKQQKVSFEQLDKRIKFLEQNLPDNFGITSGEVVDCFGHISSQLDVMIFDKSKTIKLYDGVSLLQNLLFHLKDFQLPRQCVPKLKVFRPDCNLKVL